MTTKKTESKPKTVEDVIEEYLGVHPKYLRPSGTVINVLVNQYELDNPGKRFDGFREHKFPAVIGNK